MILSHMAPSRFNMSPYRIWTIRPNSVIFIKKCLVLGPGPGPGPDPGSGPGPDPGPDPGPGPGPGFRTRSGPGQARTRTRIRARRHFSRKITEFDMKWVHMARYGLILKQDGAIWLRIISKPLPTPKTFPEWPKVIKTFENLDIPIFPVFLVRCPWCSDRY